MPRPAMSGAEPWIGSNKPPRRSAPSDAEGSKPHGAGEHRRLVGEDVAEHVLHHHHVEIARAPDEMHGRGVHQHVLVGDIGELAGHDPIDHRAPEARCLQHVRLVDRGQLAPPRAREPGGGAHHALDLRHAVAANVERLGGGALLVAEIDPTGELAHHHDIDASKHLGLDGGGLEHGRMRDDGAQVGEQPELLAQLQQSLLGPHLRIRRGPLRAADRSQAEWRRRAGTAPAWRPARPHRSRRSPRRR